ncbi:MAG: proteasome assembly chaperone family protein [Candidatus Burarchaeum sp.]|nr:proteasome assembly chaperone family protein [Candidatus Burarchaeum sp.]MDO8339154.1 proteasome assembly chaperone family protein [Candidatus Burarchaeum sp.]
MSVTIVETEKYDLKSPYLIEGFPGIGLVGTISANYMVEKLGMEPFGYITSEKFSPIASVHNYMPLHPARMYKSKKHNLVVLFSELIIPMNTIYSLSSEIFNWAKKHKCRQIVSLGGINMKGEQDEVFGIASLPELSRMIEKKGVKLIREGVTTGVSGVLLAECATRNFPAISLLAEAHAEFMDPKGAAMVLDMLSKIINVKIDTHELLSQSKEIEGKVKQMLDQAKDVHEEYKKATGLGPMYG